MKAKDAQCTQYEEYYWHTREDDVILFPKLSVLYGRYVNVAFDYHQIKPIYLFNKIDIFHRCKK
jgi:hypothetical protein